MLHFACVIIRGPRSVYGYGYCTICHIGGIAERCMPLESQGKMRKLEFWTIAYRIRLHGQTILDDMDSPFTAIPNVWRYYRADPFLFERDGRTFLFAEMYDRLLRRGVIGCCELGKEGPLHGRWFSKHRSIYPTRSCLNAAEAFT